jgi:hypothetical protein
MMFIMYNAGVLSQIIVTYRKVDVQSNFDTDEKLQRKVTGINRSENYVLFLV